MGEGDGGGQPAQDVAEVVELLGVAEVGAGGGGVALAGDGDGFVRGGGAVARQGAPASRALQRMRFNVGRFLGF
ncbi:hypothetical protein [Kitasatospora cheerisanensis]|uniref:hypothetical protein n=1 Tax=Kitasatospora cheerisanensis TaxID=81942 RepID=UPI0012EE8EED